MEFGYFTLSDNRYKDNPRTAEQFMLEFMREDLVIIETLQKGFAVNPGGAPYCEMEKTNWEFGRYIVQQVCAAPRSG